MTWKFWKWNIFGATDPRMDESYYKLMEIKKIAESNGNIKWFIVPISIIRKYGEVCVCNQIPMDTCIKTIGSKLDGVEVYVVNGKPLVYSTKLFNPEDMFYIAQTTNLTAKKVRELIKS